MGITKHGNYPSTIIQSGRVFSKVKENCSSLYEKSIEGTVA